MNYVLLGLLILIFYLVINAITNPTGDENFTQISNEMIQTIGGVYNDGLISVNNVNAQNNIKTKTLTADSITANTDPLQLGNTIVNNNLIIGGNICSGKVCLSQDDFKKMMSFWMMRDKMYDTSAIIYDNIFGVLGSVIQKSGNPSGWDDTSYSVNKWNGKTILKIGGSNQFPNGLQVTVPTGMSVVWLRILNVDRYEGFVVYDSKGTNLGEYTSGYRMLNSINPNGAATETYSDTHIWMPIPVPGSGNYVLCGTNADSDCWISGIAFSTNPWNHATNSGIAYVRATWGGSPVSWNSIWNSDQLAMIPSGSISTLYVPVVPSDNDKLLYIVEHNSNWTGTQHTSVSANGISIERFKTTYMNPFATHHNSKQYSRYIAAKIPKSLINPTDRFVKISIDMTQQNNSINFREIGTHDYL